MPGIEPQITIGDDAPIAQAQVDAGAEKRADGVTIDGKTATATDGQGRVIKVRKLSALERMRLFKIAGPEGSENNRFMAYAFFAASVCDIGGQLVGFPQTTIQLEGLVSRLDEDGLEAAARALTALSPPVDEVSAGARNL